MSLRSKIFLFFILSVCIYIIYGQLFYYFFGSTAFNLQREIISHVFGKAHSLAYIASVFCLAIPIVNFLSSKVSSLQVNGIYLGSILNSTDSNIGFSNQWLVSSEYGTELISDGAFDSLNSNIKRIGQVEPVSVENGYVLRGEGSSGFQLFILTIMSIITLGFSCLLLVSASSQIHLELIRPEFIDINTFFFPITAFFIMILSLFLFYKKGKGTKINHAQRIASKYIVAKDGVLLSEFFKTHTIEYVRGISLKNDKEILDIIHYNVFKIRLDSRELYFAQEIEHLNDSSYAKGEQVELEVKRLVAGEYL